MKIGPKSPASISRSAETKRKQLPASLVRQSKLVEKVALRQIASLHTFHTFKKTTTPKAKITQKAANRIISQAAKNIAGRVMATSGKQKRGR